MIAFQLNLPILSLILALTLLILIFFVTGLCNSSAIYSFKFTPALLVTIAPDPVFLSKKL